MKKILVLVGSTLGSSVGWWVGSPGGIWGSFLLSMFGLGVGMYAGTRLSRHLDL